MKASVQHIDNFNVKTREFRIRINTGKAGLEEKIGKILQGWGAKIKSISQASLKLGDVSVTTTEIIVSAKGSRLVQEPKMTSGNMRISSGGFPYLINCGTLLNQINVVLPNLPGVFCDECMVNKADIHLVNGEEEQDLCDSCGKDTLYDMIKVNSALHIVNDGMRKTKDGIIKLILV